VPVLRVATWNLLHGRSLVHGEVRAEDVAAGAKQLDADVVALQEVDRHQNRSGVLDLTAVVAEATGAVWWRFLPTVWGEPGLDWTPVRPDEHDDGHRAAYGIALVSRLPMLDWDVLRFPPAPFGMPLYVPGRGLTKVDDEPRGAVAAVLAGPSGPFTVVATHLSFVPGFNVSQLRHLVRRLADKPAPRLILGDLNLPGRLPRAVSGWTQLARVPTYPSWKPRVQFDHVLAQGIGEHQVQRVDSSRLPVSDHNALSLDLAL
jgi:endonuclease/exonuclease/phosphatase family metal-dependent hydrolase